MKHWRSRYSLSRYFTPPKVEPLNLDLARLDGGGYQPAQFFGETHDRRDVYVRYRGGNFSITVDDDRYTRDKTRILDIELGPPLHGFISLGQLCNYFGITINGVHPPLPTPDEMLQERLSDLSGSTTFYNVWLFGSLDTQRRFLSAALATLPEATLLCPIMNKFKVQGYEVCPTIEHLAIDHSCMILGKELTTDAATSLTPQRFRQEFEDQAIFVNASGFQHPLYKYGGNDVERVGSITGKTISVAGQVDDCLFGSFSLHSKYPTGDSNRLASLQKLDHLLDEFFPAYQVDVFDLSTGRKELEDSYITHLDPNIVDWLDIDADRWLGTFAKVDPQNPRNRRLVGYRPTRLA